MPSTPAIWAHALRYAGAVAAALALGCSLDDRKVNESDSGVTTMNESRGGTGGRQGGGSAGNDTHSATSGGGAGESGEGGESGGAGDSGESGGDGGDAVPPDAGETDDDSGTDEDAGEPPEPPACTAGNTLHLEDGWVDGSTNCVGIQGSVRADGAPSSFFLVTLDTIDLCAEGFTEEEVRSVWDVSITLLLNERQRGTSGEDYDAQAHGVVGFEFVVEPPSPLSYFGVMSDGVLYCAPITVLGTYRIALTDLHAECWNGTAGPTPNPRALRSIGFYSDTGFETNSFQFCVTDIVALTSLD